MLIYLNENPLEVKTGSRLYPLCEQHRIDIDLIVVNGVPVEADRELCQGDRIITIHRHRPPTAEDLEKLLAARHTPEVHQKIKAARVGIAGAGGLGSLVAVALTRVGIGQLDIADFDIVEPSNLNRQQYFIDQVGLPKVEALQDNLQRINPGTTINIYHQRVTPANIAEIFGGVDILVEAFDAADQKAMLVNNFLEKFPGKFLVAASGLAGYAPSNTIKTTRISEHLYLCGDGVSSVEPGCSLMAPRVGIAAHHQANAVLRIILNPPQEEES